MISAEAAPPVTDTSRRPGVVFTMRYPDDIGFVWRTIARQRDLTARDLGETVRCFLAYPALTGAPAYRPRWAEPVAADFYTFDPANRQRLAAFVARHNVGLILYMTGHLATGELAFLRRLGVKPLTTENDSYDHNRQPAAAKRAVKYLLRRAIGWRLHDLHIVNSDGQYTFFQRCEQVPAARLHLIREGIDTDHFHPGDRTAACIRLGLDPNRCWVMAAAQARPEKRVDRLLEVVRRLRETLTGVPVGFFFVGGGECLESWSALAARYPEPESYRFFGAQADLASYYQSASVFIHGSLKESFGLVIVEAMASGLPVVATRAHGPADTIADGRTGRLIERDDWDGFAAALGRYLQDPDLRRSHGEAGRSRCLERFSIGRQSRDLAAVVRAHLP